MIAEVGEGVTPWTVGTRVGVGWFGGHCGHCEPCRRGDLIDGQNIRVPGLSYDGGYADYMRTPANGLVRIPDDLATVEAAPLLCAGVTTYNALRRSGARAGDTVAILGLGGLGHLRQNGVTTRYNLAIAQWRDFRASLAARDDALSQQYVNPGMAVPLAERRIRLQLRGLSLLNAAVGLFATTTVLGLAGASLVHGRQLPAAPAILFMVVPGAAGLLFLLASTVTFFLEGTCGRALLRQHLEGAKPAAGPQDATKLQPRR